MDIPRPRLKGMQELEAEERIAEKAISAIRRKTVAVDTELQRVREDVMGELQRLEDQRSALEMNLQQLMEEQSLVLQALSDLEGRQRAHKQNLSMLKEEEFAIEEERRELNMALRELGQKKRELKDSMNSGFMQFGSARAKMQGNPKDGLEAPGAKFPSSRSPYFSNSPLEKWASSPHKGAGMHMRATADAEQFAAPMQAEPEPTVKPIFTQTAYASESMQGPISEQTQSAAPQAISPPPVSASKASKPSILKQIRLAADRFLPEPLRVNKPAAAMLEEKVEHAESAEALETSLTEKDAAEGAFPEGQGESPSEEKKGSGIVSMDEKTPSGKPAFAAPAPTPTPVPQENIDSEVESFEQRLREREAAERAENFKSQLRSRLSKLAEKSGKAASPKESQKLAALPEKKEGAIAAKTPKPAASPEKFASALAKPVQPPGKPSAEGAKPSSEKALATSESGKWKKPLAGMESRVAGAPQAKEIGEGASEPENEAHAPAKLGAASPPPDQLAARQQPSFQPRSSEIFERARFVQQPPEAARMREVKGEIVRKLNTEAKLERLHSKLQEMKSALRSLSETDRTKEQKSKKGKFAIPAKPAISPKQMKKTANPRNSNKSSKNKRRPR